MVNFETILVTGSSGVLGAAVEAVAREDHSRRFVFTNSQRCDLRDAAACAAHFAEVQPDAVVHLAAVSGGLGLTLRRPASVLRDNVLMTLNVLEAARAAGVRKLVMTMSAGVYPREAPMPLRESSIHDGPPDESNYSYAHAKRLIEPAIRAYRTEFGLHAIGLVPNGIFGEHDRFSGESTTFIAALIRRFVENRAASGPIVVWGDGTPLREITYSMDMARAFLWCLFNYDEPGALNVGTSEEWSIREIAETIADIAGVDRARIQFDPTRPNGAARRQTDNGRFVALSGFAFTPLAEGLGRTVRWFEANYEVAVGR